MRRTRLRKRFRKAGIHITAILAALAATALPAADPPARKAKPRQWVPIGRLDQNVVKEASGIVKSRKYPDIFWTHGDSGTAATLFAFRLTGELVATVPVEKALNNDWEDIAADDQGNLYVGDIGNNLRVFPARYIYVVPEPDPGANPPPHAGWTTRWKYKYPGERFNAEALFVLNGRMYVISIGQQGRPTTYRLDPIAEDECKLTLIQTLPVWMAQGADVSLDGKRLVVCTGEALWVFDVDPDGAVPKDKKPNEVTFPLCSAEACCFDGKDVILLTEQGNLFRVTEADIRANTNFVQAPGPQPR